MQVIWWNLRKVAADQGGHPVSQGQLENIFPIQRLILAQLKDAVFVLIREGLPGAKE